MLDDLKRQVDKLKATKEFRDYKKSNPHAFLCACFSIVENIKEVNWQIDFYSRKDKKMVTFLQEGKVEARVENVFQKDKSPVEELKLDRISIDFGKAISIADNFMEKMSEKEKGGDRIVVLQKVGRELWNITMLTKGFKVVNVKIDAITGEVMEGKSESVFSFKQG